MCALFIKNYTCPRFSESLLLGYYNRKLYTLTYDGNHHVFKRSCLARINRARIQGVSCKASVGSTYLKK